MTSNEAIYSSTYIEQSTVNSAKSSRQQAHVILDDLVDDTGKLNWDLFYKYCLTPAWNHVNKIQTQIRCSHLDGVVVHWNGIVSETEITDVKNLRSDIISYLPMFLVNRLACFYGDQNEAVCYEQFKTEDCEEIKDLIENRKKCNLNKWNR